MTHTDSNFPTSPVRQIGKSYRTLTGKLNLPGINKKIAYESPLERDFFILQWFDPLMISMLEQPIEIFYETGKYTPDALISYKNKPPLLVEVKPSRFLRKKHLRKLEPKFNAARHYAEARGWTFEIFDEKKIRTARFQLARYMLRFAREPYKTEELQGIVGILRDLGRKASFATVLQAARSRGMAEEEATRLIQQARPWLTGCFLTKKFFLSC